MLGEPPAQVGVDEDLILDWGLDSIRVMGFLAGLRAEGIEITMLELAEEPTLRAWDALLTARTRDQSTG